MNLHVVRCTALLLLTVFALLLQGCASGPQKPSGPAFFPPPPNLPRIQYLFGFSTSDDVEGKDTSFSLFDFGLTEQKRVRRLIKPYGMATAGGKLYVTDTVGQLMVVDLPNKTFEPLRGNNGFGKLKKPVNVAVDEKGFVYVADTGRKEVVVYDNNGDFLKTVGREFDSSTVDVAVQEDKLYVLDSRRSLLRVIDLATNTLIKEIGRGDTADQSLNIPTNMYLDSRGIIYVVNVGSGKVITFDRDGNFLSSFGKMGDGFGQFSRPRGIALSPEGIIYVVDAAFQNVQMFNEQGRLLLFFGDRSQPAAALNLPSGIAVSTDNLPYYQQFADKNFELEQVIFVANQFGDTRVSVFGLGRMRGIDYEGEYQRLRAERERKAKEELDKRKAQEEAEKKQQKDQQGGK